MLQVSPRRSFLEASENERRVRTAVQSRSAVRVDVADLLTTDLAHAYHMTAPDETQSDPAAVAAARSHHRLFRSEGCATGLPGKFPATRLVTTVLPSF